jgi:hypothetical protein
VHKFQVPVCCTSNSDWLAGLHTIAITTVKVKGTGKDHPRTGHTGKDGKKRYSSTLSLTSVLDGGWWSTPRPGLFTPGKDLVSTVQEAGWAPGLVWMGAENLTTWMYIKDSNTVVPPYPLIQYPRFQLSEIYCSLKKIGTFKK